MVLAREGFNQAHISTVLDVLEKARRPLSISEILVAVRQKGLTDEETKSAIQFLDASGKARICLDRTVEFAGVRAAAA